MGGDVFGVMCAMVADIVNEMFSVIWCALVSGKVDGGMVFHGVVGGFSVAWCIVWWHGVWYGGCCLGVWYRGWRH